MQEENFMIYSTNPNQRRGEKLDKNHARLYMYVTDDKFELPLVVACSAQELADTLGFKYNTVVAGISRYKNGKRNTRYRVVDVEIEDTDFE